MQLAFCLYKYFPYGGLQRDFLRIAQICAARGHAVRVYTLEWEGAQPDDMDIVIVPVRGLTNPARYRRFTDFVQRDLAARPADRVVGFNKMPGLDVYYAADPCFEHKARTLRSKLYRYSPRYRHFSAYERAVFAPSAHTKLMMISATQRDLFAHYYATPAERFHMLPPGIAADRRAPANAADIRAAFRAEFKLADDDLLLMQIGSDFPRKGLDRSLAAMAALPEALRRRTRLIALGADDPKPFLQQAETLGIADQVSIPGGRDDVPRFLLGGDLLLHPARHENTGTVLLEALVAGLPLIATATCGYAHYIEQAQAGRVIPEPFAHDAFNRLLGDALANADLRAQWSRNALAWADTADIYSLPERAADIVLGQHTQS